MDMQILIHTIENTVAETLEGNFDPLKIYIDLKRLQKSVNECIEAVNDYALNEAQKHGTAFNYEGAKVNIRSAAGRFKFDHLPDYTQLKEQLKQVEELHKEAFKMAEKGAKMITEDGEIIEPAHFEPGKLIMAVSL